MPSKRPSLLACAVVTLTLASSGCKSRPTPLRPPLGALADRVVLDLQRRDHELEACTRQLTELRAAPPLPGVPQLDRERAELLGRAKGEPVIFVAEPAVTPEADLPAAARETRRAIAKLPPAEQIRSVLRRHYRDYPTLRALLLREGYLFAAGADEALSLVKLLELPKLFDEPEIWLMRANAWHRLRRTTGRQPEYRHTDGPLAGATAELRWADRVAVDRAGLSAPLHRDVGALADELGFDRARVDHLGRERLSFELRFGTQWVTAVVDSREAGLSLRCLAASRKDRDHVAAWRESNGSLRRALRALQQAVTAEVVERLPFDRPRGAKDHLTDGLLRPQWRWAYQRGRFGFSHEGDGYPVFDAEGRPTPPQMCVDFVLDSFERAAGTWYRGRDAAERGKQTGRLDFDTLGIGNRAGVLAFGKFAQSHPELFEFRPLPEEQRVPFGDRPRFFATLLEHADDYAPGDVVAIQGIKRDGNVHQHAILIERTDPMTGFPYGLADQMKWPRRRTWEGIMGEAPRRSLLFHVRLRPNILIALDPEAKAVGREAG